MVPDLREEIQWAYVALIVLSFVQVVRGRRSVDASGRSFVDCRSRASAAAHAVRSVEGVDFGPGRRTGDFGLID